MATYPYNLFITNKTVSPLKLEKIIYTNIFKPSTRESILEKYKTEIDDYLVKNKVKISDFRLFQNILTDFSNNIFDIMLLRDYNIDNFFKNLIYFKDLIILNKSNINLLLNQSNNLNKINNNLIKKYNEQLIFHNPINKNNIENILFYYDSTVSSTTHTYFHELDRLYLYNTDDYLKITLIIQILLLGDYINISLPSIGNIYKIDINPPTISGVARAFTHQKINNNYVDFIKKLCNIKDITEHDFNEEIPLISLDISEHISELLLNDISINKLNNNFSYNFDNNSMKLLIKNNINDIKIKLDEVLKTEFIIPYKIVKNKKTSVDELELMSKYDVEKYKKDNYKDVLKNNYSLIEYAIKNTFLYSYTSTGTAPPPCDPILITYLNDDIKKKLEEKNMKNVLACYLFFIINFVTGILKSYIEKIDNILKNILDTREKRFKILNIKEAFDYTSLLSKSLLKFKLILLNNFYNLFLPSKISNGNYGMKLDENNCYVPESIFLNSNENIFENYPFTSLDYTSNSVCVNGKKLLNFIITMKDNKDIYQSDMKLEFGGNAFNYNIMKNSFDILKDFYKSLQKTNNFNLFIVEKIIHYFHKNNIPYELIINIQKKNIIPLFASPFIPTFEREILKIYDTLLDKSTNFYLKVIDIRNKKKYIKQTNIHNLTNLEEISFLLFKIYFIQSSCLNVICEKLIRTDIKLKNTVLKKMIEMKKKYEKIILDKMKHYNNIFQNK